mmetsp:Transcript_6017/g.8946  ORF Transcript_6017/g.8946 Transcript_6017/m.8946 type:complete len:394 (-) Transcript_6017:44-1225(-)
MSLSHSPQLNRSELITSWGPKHNRALKSMTFDNSPSFYSNYPQDNDKNAKCISLPNGVEGDDFARSKHPKRKLSVKKHTSGTKEITVKKPRSPYNLFFQVERELIMSDLSCSPEARFLASHESSPFGSKKKQLLTLENAFLDTPLPARYRGTNILNPIYAIKTERRKHRKSHGKISFIQLSKKIAQNWNNSDKGIKDYFKELSVKDYERYKSDLKKSKDHDASVARLAADDGILSVKSSTAYGNQMEIRRYSDATNFPTANKKRKLMQGGAHTEVCRKQHCSTSITYKSPQMEELTIQDVQTKQPIKCLSQDNCMAISSEALPCRNGISNVACAWPVSLGKTIFVSSDRTEFEPLVRSSYQLCRDFKEGRTQAQYEDEVDKDIMQFLFDLVNE